MKSIIGFLNNYNLHAIFSTVLLINLHGVKKIYFAVLEEIYTSVGQQFYLLQSFNYKPYLFYKKPYKSEINYFCIHRKKRFTSFPSPAGMSLTKLPLGRNNSVMTSLFPPRESLVVTSRLGTGNSRTFFYGV
jgi:hypothetical protein